MIQIKQLKKLLLLTGFFVENLMPVFADDGNCLFQETFDKISGDAISSNSVFDNSGWSFNGKVFKGKNIGRDCIRLGDTSNLGSLTTPELTNIPNYTILTFLVRGYDDDEREINISGTNCTVSPSSFSNLPYDSWYTCTVYVGKTGDNPRITFSTVAGKRVYLDDVKIEDGGTCLNVNISVAKYATLYYRRALDFSGTGISAYTAKAEPTKVVLTKIQDGIVPPNTGVVLYSENAGEYPVSFTITDKTSQSIGENELVGTYTDTEVKKTDGAYTNYILSNEASGVGFYLAAENGAKLRANRAYLHTKESVGSRMLSFETDDTTTGINDLLGGQEGKPYEKTVFDLQGRLVAQPRKGLYVVNGKLTVIYK